MAPRDAPPFRPAGLVGRKALGFLGMLLCLQGPTWGQDRRALLNRCNQPWTLALVEGGRAGDGSISFLDKFSGRNLGTLGRVGEAATIPAKGRMMLVFNRREGYFYHNFIIKDARGFYAEYVASVEFLSSPRITIQLVDQHVGPPLDRGDEGDIKRFIADSIEVNSESIIINQNVLIHEEKDNVENSKWPNINVPSLNP